MALREVAADLEVNVKGGEKVKKLEHEIDSLHKTLHEFGQSMKSFAVEAAEIFAIGELKEFVHGQVELGEALERTSAKTGLSTDELQKWQYVAEQSALGTDEVASALGRLQSQLGGGAKGRHGMAGASQELQKLGIQAKDTAGKARPVGDIFMDVADKIKKTEDPTKRAAIAVQVFGRQGREMLPVLMKGKEGIEEMTKEAEKMGFILGDDFLEKTKKAAEEQTKLNWSMRSLKATIATELFPSFTKIIDKVMHGVTWFNKLSKETTFVKTALAALGFAAGVRLLGPLKELLGISKGKGLIDNIFGVAKIAGALVGLAALYIAWDELFGLFTGKETWIGTMIDRVFGKGSSASGVQDMKDAWKEIFESITGVNMQSDVWSETLSHLVGGVLFLGRAAGRAFGTIIAEINVMYQSAKGLLTMLDVSSSHEDVEKQDKVTARAITTASKMESSIFDTTGINFKPRTSITGQDVQDYNYDNAPKPVGSKFGPPVAPGVVVHQSIVVHGGDPTDVKDAVNKGTNQALSQNDLQHTRQAVRSTTPPVGDNYNPVGNP
jgi:hypothetical protein